MRTVIAIFSHATSAGLSTCPSKCESGMNPSMSLPMSTTTPFSIRRATTPGSSVPTGYDSPIRSQGSSEACLRPSEIRLFSASMLRITTSTVSPFLTTSDGCWTRLVHDMSEMWMSPSIPASISTKAPNEVRLRTLPLRRVPTGYLCGSTIHGSCSVCFMPSEIFSSVVSTLSTTASIDSPMLTSFEGCRTLRVQLISEMCTRPSMPGSSSMKAP